MMLSEIELSVLLDVGAAAGNRLDPDNIAVAALVAGGLATVDRGEVYTTPLGERHLAVAMLAKLSEAERFRLRRINNAGVKEAKFDVELVRSLARHGLVETRDQRIYTTPFGKRCAHLLEQLSRLPNGTLEDLLRDTNT